MNAISNKEERDKLRKERNTNLRKIHEKLAEEDMEETIQLVEEIEAMKDDSRRMYKVANQLQRRKEKKNSW